MKLQKWTRPKCYFGSDWQEYYIFLSQTRDSDELEQSNFQCALDAIGGESGTVIVVQENHFLCGWIEWIAIHESNTKAIAEAETILDQLENYPVLDEEDFSNREFETACETWKYMSIRERVEFLQGFGSHRKSKWFPSIFSARRDDLPDNLPHHDGLIGH